MGKILCMGYIRRNTRAYINSYRDVVLEGCDRTVAGKNNSVGTLEEKQTDRDVVGTICTRLVQIQTDSPYTGYFKKKECRDTREKTDRSGCRRYDMY